MDTLLAMLSSHRVPVLGVVGVLGLLASLVYSALAGQAAAVLLLLVGLLLLQRDGDGWEVYLVGAVVVFLVTGLA